MANKLPLLNISLKRALETVPDELKKAQIRIFFLVFMLNFLKWGVTIPYVTLTVQVIWGYVVGMIVTIVVLKLLLSRPQYLTALIHVALIAQLEGNWRAVFFSGNGIHLLTVLHIFMPVMWSFYGLGRRWGMIYSVAYTLLIPIYLVYAQQAGIELLLLPRSMPFYVFVANVVINLFVIVIAHYYYQGALFRVMENQHKLNNKLSNLVKVKSDFLSSMSHELRTPLNTVIGSANLLMDAHGTPAEQENLDNLRYSAESLLVLINDILDFNKIELNKIGLESISFNVTSLLEQVCNGFKSKAAAKGLDLILEVDEKIRDVMVQGDPARLTQIMVNLIDNALKFTVSGSVTVQGLVRLKKEGHMTVGFSVKDTGIGIAEEKQDLIFDPFSQASTAINRRFGGSGLGLAIVKHLVRLHESAITLKSELGKGAEFYFEIMYPVVQRKQADWQPPSDKGVIMNGDLSHLRVLLAEDNPMTSFFMQKMLAKWKIDVALAENGVQVIEMLEQGPWDVVLMDIQMPLMDGFEATARIRLSPDPAIAGIHIIALTASVSDEIGAKIEQSGMDDYISKPFDPNDLYAALEKAGGRHYRA